MASTSFPTPKPNHALNILALIAALAPVVEAIINSRVKSDKTKTTVSTVSTTVSQLIPIVTGVLAAQEK